MAYPADWLYAIRATQTDGNNSERPLEIVPNLETNVGFIGNPNSIAYPAAAGSASGLVRVSPKPGTLAGTQVVVGLYKKVMTPFTNQTIFSSTLPFDDEWFMVFEEGILWQAYLYADDRRGGDVSVDSQNGVARFSGQRAVFEAALTMMKDREKLIMLNPFSVDQKDYRK